MPYEEYFKTASESLIIADPKGRILEANSRTEELFGYRGDELIGQSVEILLPVRLRHTHTMHVASYFDAPRTRTMGIGLSLAARRKDGSEFPVEVSLTYAPATSRGEVVVATVIDITQRLALEREARRAESISSLGTIATGIAHDLNNPLQIILSRSELLLQTCQEGLSDEAREDLAIVQRHAQRATRIIDEFLRVSQHREKSVAPLQLNRLVDSILLLIGAQLRDNRIRVETRLEAELPMIMGNASALERVLINILTNAREAMLAGGTLTIETGRADAQNWVRLSVTDTGPGIPAEALTKVFDLLYTTKSEGTGLGLWLGRRIVQEHGGKIEVESKAGTTFTISLPAAGEST